MKKFFLETSIGLVNKIACLHATSLEEEAQNEVAAGMDGVYCHSVLETVYFTIIPQGRVGYYILLFFNIYIFIFIYKITEIVRVI